MREREEYHHTSWDSRQRARRANLPDDYVPGDLKKKGVFAAINPTSAHLLLPNNSSVCPDFAFVGRKCKRGGPCPNSKRHFYAAKQMNVKEVEDIGDSFLANKDGFFVARAFKGCPMAPKYDCLFGSINNRT